MPERRQQTRQTTPRGQRLLTLHSQKGYVCARAEDESEGGLGVLVRETDNLGVGQTVLIHRMHEDVLRMGTIRHLGPASAEGQRVGIELFP